MHIGLVCGCAVGQRFAGRTAAFGIRVTAPPGPAQVADRPGASAVPRHVADLPRRFIRGAVVAAVVPIHRSSPAAARSPSRSFSTRPRFTPRSHIGAMREAERT